MEWTKEGRVWLFGSNVDADLAIDFSQAIAMTVDEQSLRSRCMIGYDPKFPDRAKAGDFIIAETNFGCGHAHPQFYFSLKYFHLSAILVESMPFRLAKQLINFGVPVLCSPQVSTLRQMVKAGDRIRLDLSTGHAVNLETGEEVAVEPLDPFVLGILERGGVFGETTDRILGL